MTVAGLGAGASSTVTVTAAKSGFTNTTASLLGHGHPGRCRPRRSARSTSGSTGYTVPIANYDAAETYTATVTAGNVTISSNFVWCVRAFAGAIVDGHVDGRKERIPERVQHLNQRGARPGYGPDVLEPDVDDNRVHGDHRQLQRGVLLRPAGLARLGRAERRQPDRHRSDAGTVHDRIRRRAKRPTDLRAQLGDGRRTVDRRHPRLVGGGLDRYRVHVLDHQLRFGLLVFGFGFWHRKRVGRFEWAGDRHRPVERLSVDRDDHGDADRLHDGNLDPAHRFRAA